MKKLCLLLVLSLLLTACGHSFDSRDFLQEAGAICSFDPGTYTLLEGNDSHGGFHGDGESFLILQFSEDPPLSEPLWQSLPMDDTARTLIYGLETDSGRKGPYLSAQFPELEEGYYLLLDRHSQSSDGKAGPEMLERYSYNFTAALYDPQTRRLYYAEMDT